MVLFYDFQLTKHWFPSLQDAPLAEDMNKICATFRPPMTFFLMTGASFYLDFQWHITSAKSLLKIYKRHDKVMLML